MIFEHSNCMTLNCMQLNIYILIIHNNFEASFVQASKVQRSAIYHKKIKKHTFHRSIHSSALDIESSMRDYKVYYARLTDLNKDC